MKHMSTATVALFISILTWTGCVGVRCYWCVYVSKNSDSQSSCSDPWPWYRETFGDMYKPPIRNCPFSDVCMKIIINNAHGYNSVVRTCGSPCNESSSSTTTTTCCQGDLCNHSYSVTSSLITFIVTFVVTYVVSLL